MAANQPDTPQPYRRRGRPRSFDRDKALWHALKVFQTNGYDGTSMGQLVDAMGIVSPSIYAAFGSKEDLFREAVELYRAEVVEPVWVKLDEVTPVRAAVEEMLLASLDIFVASGAQHGCLVMLGTGHLGGSNENVRLFLREQRLGFKTRLEARFKPAVENGDIPPDNDPETLAECVLAFFGGMAIESVDGVDAAILRRSIRFFCARILG